MVAAGTLLSPRLFVGALHVDVAGPPQGAELVRRIFEARAERADPTQLEIEFAKTKAALDEMQKEQATGVTEPTAPRVDTERETSAAVLEMLRGFCGYVGRRARNQKRYGRPDIYGAAHTPYS